MIKCGKLKGKDGETAEQCILYTKDGSKALGYFLYSEYGGEKGARAAAHKREGAVQFFKEKHRGLLDALDAFGAPVVLKYLLDRTADCAACQEMVKAYVEAQGDESVEKAEEKKTKLTPKRVDVTEDNIRLRVREPGNFQEDSFRIIDIDAERGIKAVIGRLKGQQTTTTQAYLFAREKKWTEEKARKWLEDQAKSRSKKEKSFTETAEEALIMLKKDKDDIINLNELERWLGEVGDDKPAGDAEPEPEPAAEPETAGPEPEPAAEELPNDFRAFLLRDHAQRRAGVLAMLEEVEDNG